MLAQHVDMVLLVQLLYKDIGITAAFRQQFHNPIPLASQERKLKRYTHIAEIRPPVAIEKRPVRFAWFPPEIAAKHFAFLRQSDKR